jgi:hypothetical protein
MSGKETLLRSLFDSPEKELLNIKFFQAGSGVAASEQEFCDQVDEVVFDIRAGLTKPLDRIDEDDLVQVDVQQFVKKLAPCN